MADSCSLFSPAIGVEPKSSDADRTHSEPASYAVLLYLWAQAASAVWTAAGTNKDYLVSNKNCLVSNSFGSNVPVFVIC